MREPGSGIALPYTLDPEVADALRAPRPRSRRARPHLPWQTIAALREVGALADGPQAGRRRAAWRRELRQWRRELRARGCVVLRGLFTPVFLAAVREYYRRLEAEGYLLGGRLRGAGTPELHDDPLLSFLGRQLASVVRQVTGERAPWTFSFLRVYGGGAVLRRHRDAPVCRWNIDLVVGGAPKPEPRTAWPLWVEAGDRARPVRLGLGDGLLYRGTDLRHWRRAQPESHTTVLAALHYGSPPR